MTCRNDDVPVAPYKHDTFTSYSLNFEDVVLHRAFAGQASGFYVDVGAGHPRFENDTLALHERGWSGINVEPNEAFIAAFREARPNDHNLCIALSDAEGEICYHEIPGTGLSTCDPAQAEAHATRGHEIRARQVRVLTLARVLDEADAPTVDVLKVDVEGMEEQVLAGNDWTRFRPRLVVVEATYPERPERRATRVRRFLEERGYQHAHFDGLNDFYVEQGFELPGTFTLPPNVFDGFTLREVADLRAETAALRAEFGLAQAYAASLEAVHADDARTLAALTTERGRLQEEFASAEAYVASLEEERRALQAQAAVQEAALAAARRQGAQAAPLEAMLVTLLRGRSAAAVQISVRDGTPRLTIPARGGHVMDVARENVGEGETAEAGSNVALANRLLAAQVEGLHIENRRLGLDLDDLREENRRLRASAEQMRAEILVLSRALEPMHRLNEELASWRSRTVRVETMAGAVQQLADEVATRHAHSLDELRASLDQEQEHAEQLAQSLQKEHARAEQLARHVQALHASSSWRLTRSWRALGRLVKGRRDGR